MRPPSSAKRPRLSVDVSPSLRRRLRVAAARRDVTVGKYVLTALERQIQQDLRDDSDAILALTAAADPVLAELWDNPKDAAYDRL
jgi:uncharacterized protein (DUF1778 family)